MQNCQFPSFLFIAYFSFASPFQIREEESFPFFPIGQQAIDETLGQLTRRFPDIYLSEYNLGKLYDIHHPVSFLLALLLNGTWLQCFQGELRVECCEQQKEHSLHFFS